MTRADILIGMVDTCPIPRCEHAGSSHLHPRELIAQFEQTLGRLLYGPRQVALARICKAGGRWEEPTAGSRAGGLVVRRWAPPGFVWADGSHCVHFQVHRGRRAEAWKALRDQLGLVVQVRECPAEPGCPECKLERFYRLPPP